MRWTLLLILFVLLAANAANDACAQHGGGHGFGGGGHGRGRGGYGYGRSYSPYGYGYPYGYADLPFDSDNDAGYGYPPQPTILVQQPPMYAQPPAPPPVELPVHPVTTEYKWPSAGAASSHSAPSTTSDSEPQAFAIVLKNGSTLSAVAVFASDDVLHYVDPDERHLRISMSEVDRAATLKVNRARNLDLYLPAAQ